MRRLFNCLKLFVEWIHCGLYDFASLPLSLRVHLDPNDVETLENIPQCYCKFQTVVSTPYVFTSVVKQSNQLLKHLEEFEKLLNHSQGYIAFNAIVKSFVVCLEKDWGLYDPKDEIHRLIDLIPKTIMIHHYVHFRMALRRSVIMCYNFYITTFCVCEFADINLCVSKHSTIVYLTNI